MKTLVLVSDPADWPSHLPGVEVLSGRAYLTDPKYSKLRGARVFNLCRSYRYQTTGYYASLLAAARGQRPIPSVGTILDMKSQSFLRIVSEDLDEVIQRSLGGIKANRFVLSIYFGRNLAKRHQQLSRRLSNLFPAPMLRAVFARAKKWRLQSISPIAGKDVPDSHWAFVLDAAESYFSKARFSTPRRVESRYDLAILVDGNEDSPPSDERALRRFERAARSLGIQAERIGRDDYGNLGEFDALFIRTTTAVNHYTYRFARRAEALGLAVIDDPASILKCTNKVFLAELLERYGIPAPPTRILHRQNVAEVLGDLGLPCILKQPDSSFSKGVVKAATEEDYLQRAHQLLEDSDLVIAQSFVPTDFDWRVGILDREPLYACRYFMAPKHWQIIHREGSRLQEGRVETMLVEDAPPRVIRVALKAANLFGDGLYGVDLKQRGRDVWVIEVNDNPNVDAGYEDRVLGQELYRRVMASFERRIEQRRGIGAQGRA